jgi:hypothetical protein
MNKEIGLVQVLEGEKQQREEQQQSNTTPFKKLN